MQKIIELLKKLHAKEHAWLTLVTTGTGMGLVKIIQSITGSSKTLKDAYTPYSRESSIAYIQTYVFQAIDPNTHQYVCRATADLLVHAAFRKQLELLRANKLSEKGLLAVSITGNVDMGKARKNNRCFQTWISIHDGEKTIRCNIVYPRYGSGFSVLGRAVENALADFFALKMIFEYFEIGELNLYDFSCDEKPNGLTREEKDSLQINFYNDKENIKVA